MEDEPIIRLSFNGEDLEARRDNASLFTFMGELACYDHVFIVSLDDEENTVYNYIFCSNDSYDELRQALQDNDYTQHLNMNEVADMDVRSFESHHYRDIRSSDFAPDAWFDKEGE
jgi:hypothetical protein